MSIKKSQQFLYFQNKARHYENIRKAKPCINDQLEKQYRHTIDHSPSHSRPNSKQPYLKMYNIQVDNEHLINRLVNITKSKRTQVSAQGNYSRFHSVERPFRTKNPYRDQTQRKILAENQQMVNRLDLAKPAIGSNFQWTCEYERQLSHRKNMSRYNDGGQSSKGLLHISTSRFLPEHYKSYILDLEGEKKGETVAVISKQKLTKLPRILYHEKSNSVLASNKSQNDLLNV